MYRPVVIAAALLFAAAACSPPPGDDPPDTVGEPPVVTDITTIVPIVVDTDPPEVGTAPPGALFAGDPCTSLEEGDFSRTTIAGSGSGRLVDTIPVSIDACQYVVEAGGDQYDVVVSAQTQADFDATPASDVEVTEISGVGLEARGFDLGDRYEVIVHVDNGWFAVTTPDRTSAAFLARQAVRRAG